MPVRQGRSGLHASILGPVLEGTWVHNTARLLDV